MYLQCEILFTKLKKTVLKSEKNTTILIYAEISVHEIKIT